MFRRAFFAALVVAALFLANARLPAAPCVVTNTPSPKACQPGCCANKTCCRTSHQRTGIPVQPLTKSSSDQQNVVAPAVTVPSPLIASFASQSIVVYRAEQAAHLPPRLILFCTLLI